MKRNLLAILTLTGLSAVAQTPRLSLYEEFTGETCPPCASTNPGLNVKLASPTNTPLIVAIKWQVPIPSAPANAWSLYQTYKTDIDWRWKSVANGGYGYSPAINSAPSSKIDGQEATVFGATSGHPANLTNAVIASAASNTAAFSVTMNRAWDATYSSVDLTVSIVASANFTATGPLVFRTVMVEKFIHFPVQPGTNGEKDFEDVAIASFPTLQNGVSMAPTWTVGQTQTFTINCPLPSYTRDKAQVAFVGFIQDDGNQKVAQAVRSNPSPLANDAKAVSATMPLLTCTTSSSPQISVKNNGTNAITALTITPYIDGVAGTNYPWTGNLAVGASTNLTLNSMSLTGGTHTFSYNISGVSGTDNNMNNNSEKAPFIVVANYQGTPVAEGFTQTAFPPAKWAAFNTNNAPTWIRSTACGGFGLTTNSTKLDFYNTISAGAVNDLLLPPVSMTAVAAPSLSFDVAYSQYANGDDDKLEVFVSTDCGATWNNVYTQSGTNLSTTGAFVTAAFVPSAAQWRKEEIELTGYTGELLIKFTGTSDFGNNLYLDNINLKQAPNNFVSLTNIKNNGMGIEVFPNPSNGPATIKISSTAHSTANVSIVNALGQIVFTKSTSVEPGDNNILVDGSNFASGIYNVTVDTDNGSISKKLTINK